MAKPACDLVAQEELLGLLATLMVEVPEKELLNHVSSNFKDKSVYVYLQADTDDKQAWAKLWESLLPM